MIERCPISMECRLYNTLETSSHDIFFGEVVATYVEEGVLTVGKVDLKKVRPLLFDMSSRKYWSIGEEVGSCWGIGKTFQPNNPNLQPGKSKEVL